MEYQKSPLKAIQKKCLECSGDNKNEVRLCTVENCELYPYRFGKNPFNKKTGLTEEQLADRSIRMKELRINFIEKSKK